MRLRAPDWHAGWARAVAVALRTGHLLTMGAFLGGTLAGLPRQAVAGWRSAAAATGLLLLFTEATSGRRWLVQLRGLFVLAHVAVLLLLLVDGLRPAAAVLAVVIGGVGSHMPRQLRKWSVTAGRVED